MTYSAPGTEISSWADQPCTASSKSLVREMLTRIGDKWTILVISTLSDGPLRFTHLLVRIPGISHRMLTRTLRSLERDGLVTRDSFPEVPPRVEYGLTDVGATLIVPIRALIDWVNVHEADVERSRAFFDD